MGLYGVVKCIISLPTHSIEMKNTQKPLLGSVTALTITTPDLEASLSYYNQLGFVEVMRADWPFPWIQVSDGVLLIMLRKDPKPYLALTYYVKDITGVISDLKQKGITFAQEPKKADALKRAVMISPDGLNISLVGMVDGFKQPKGPGMLNMPPEDYMKPEKYVNKTCGLYGELAHPVKDLEASLAYWELLGFKAVSKYESPYPWAIISDGLSVVGLHQTATFDYPAITYFAADMRSKIASLKKNGLTNYTDKGAGSIVLTTPEQQHINLFSMGMGEDPIEKKVIQQNVIETERLLLKELNPSFVKEIMSQCTDEELMGWFGLHTAEALEAEKNKHTLGIANYRTSYKQFILVEKATGIVLGRGGFHNWYAMHRRAELGYAMDSDYGKRKGYMTEAVTAILKYGFEHMDLNRVEAYVGRHNEPSLKIVKGHGFTQEGILREHFCKNDVIEDSVCFGLLLNEYEQAKSKG
ncbi:MAG: alanine acetyltransferase [Flavipsychrobacter sp.]|nr:alanine acetyltransferase [Flavipsychrobacter sp.]